MLRAISFLLFAIGVSALDSTGFAFVLALLFTVLGLLGLLIASIRWEAHHR